MDYLNIYAFNLKEQEKNLAPNKFLFEDLFFGSIKTHETNCYW